MKKLSDNFWNVDWGSDESKGDDKLSSYFVRIPEFDKIKQGERRYIIGRKGTGKTAIIEQIINEIDNTYDNFHVSLSLKNFPVQSIRNLKDKSYGDKSQFVPIWSFLIYNELSKLVLSDNSITSEAANEIKSYIKLNFSSEIGFTDTIKKLESNQNKLSVLPKWLTFESNKTVSSEGVTQVHYQKVTTILSDKLKQIDTNANFYIFFDELDEGYNADDKNLRLILLSLLRAVENAFLDLRKYINFRPVLALRSDIFDNLEDNDLNKLDDYLIRLKWTTESKSPYSLYDLVNARINASIDVIDSENAWEYITENRSRDLPKQIDTLWSFIYNRTFERPRDILKFLKICSKAQSQGRLTFQNVKNAELDYSSWFYNEFRDEVQSHLPVWKEAIEAIMRLGKYRFNLNEIKAEFESIPQVSNYIEQAKKKPEDILNVLYDFGVIGTISPTGKWFFKYKDHDLFFNPKLDMIVHFGFTKKLRLTAY